MLFVIGGVLSLCFGMYLLIDQGKYILEHGWNKSNGSDIKILYSGIIAVVMGIILLIRYL